MRSKPAIAGGGAVFLALAAALSFESVYRISARPRPPEDAAPAPAATPRGALPLRLVDSGGVGIPLDGDWGSNYSHDRRSFRDVILEQAPYVDTTAFARVANEWRAYVERMHAYGNNAIAVPLFLELADFDRVRTQSDGDAEVYPRASPFRLRHAEVRRHFGPLFEWTRGQGLQVFLDTDMLALTAPLARHLRRVAPAATVVGIDTRNAAVWDAYRAAFDELFDRLPSIAGVVIRFGEGGSLYNTAGWPYESQMGVRDADALRAMLRGLLPLFEARAKTLVLRSWTVGVGRIGKLHIDPAVYEAVLGDIDSPALVVSTKFTGGDFFSYLPLNQTLKRGRHRRIVELQAKPEFEGFGAFPDFLGEEHARAMRLLTAANPNIVGTYVLPQFGGPLRAGPRMLYPLHGFWLWTDANVFVASRLAIDRDADVGTLARQWASATFGPDPGVVDAVTHVLTDTRTAVREGFYIRPFAEREVRVPGLELPPLMWIFEWDMVGGWHSLLSIVFRGTRDAVDVAIAEGHEAAAIVRRSRARLQAAVDGARAPCEACAPALRSLEYQETLFDALAAWRQAFLSYYRWLETGDRSAWTAWREGSARFKAAAERHVSRFGNDLDFPAFDLTSAMQAVSAAERAGWVRAISASLVAIVIAALGLGWSITSGRWRPARWPSLARCARLAWATAVTPWRLEREPVDLPSALTVTTFALVLVGVLVGALTGFTTVWLGAGSPFLVGIVAAAFESTAIGLAGRQGRGRLLVAAVGPFIPGVAVLFALVAYLGPVGFWYGFWTSPVIRAVFLTILLATLLWTAAVMLTARGDEEWHGRVGGWLAAAGAGLVTLTALLPDWVDVLRFLDSPLNFAPATDTMLFALRTYAGVSLSFGGPALLAGAVMLAGGYSLWLRSALRAR
jgi:hypothetical protein